jgi:RimJ/RimL family protein N-acetyltransferase
MLDEAPFGEHASIQIHINQTHRGRGIGSVAYRLACEQSGNDEVIATMRKSNLASQRAAAQAGFKVIEDMKIPQLAMRWTRSQQQ